MAAADRARGLQLRRRFDYDRVSGRRRGMSSQRLLPRLSNPCMSHKYNVGIIGYGWAATAHIAAINGTSLGRVTDVWSSRPLDAAELSQRHGCPIRVHSDLDAMLASPDVHVVDITGYPDQHAVQFIRAARAGKHVIIEKPLAVEWSHILEMKKAVEETRIRTCVCFECRFSSQFLATKSVIDAG